jgi:cellulose synthase/poly-beta-1,6-N-acetylglucosamine synthase-like glycosyltransferase
MKLGLDLALEGHPPQLCPDALVTSELPTSQKAAVKQRSRWEHGHVQTIVTQVPRLLRAGVIQGRCDLLGLALELSVPPLSLLFLAWGVVTAASLGLWLADGSEWPALVLCGGLLAVLLALLACWFKFGRRDLPLTTLLSAPFYILWKVPIYLALVFRPQKAWVRTERSTPGAPETPADPR